MSIKKYNDSVSIYLDLSKYDERFKKAQIHLDQVILYDTEPYVRYDTGLLNYNAMSQNKAGSGEIIYSAYSDNGFNYASSTYYNTENNVTRLTHYKATPLWFEYSKMLNKETWIKEVKEIVGGKK